MKFDALIIGAGAAGMMCAAQAGQRGRRVLLIDHAARIGERIRISGGGRCNFTNRTVGPENFLSQNPHFCRSALAQYSQHDFIRLVERHNIPYHEKTLGQLFCDNSAHDIITLLKSECDKGGVEWAYPCEVKAITAMPGQDSGQSARFRIETSEGHFECASLVVATGGLAAPALGASPFGYRLAEQFNIPVVPPRPALVPLALPPETLNTLKPLAGLSFSTITTCGKHAPLFREETLITHRGLSGPAILQVSSYWQMQDYQTGNRHPVMLNLLPDEDAKAWLNTHRKQNITLPSLLAGILPRRFGQEWCALQGIDRPLSELSAKKLQQIAQLLNAWPLTPSGTLGYNKAEVTLGGVDTRALSSRTMEAIKVPGLFFIGEVVDVTGWLGGYNFQWAWSSGWVAGQHV
ncbi:MAG: NAD(P)/FAD-dependent oxidoreductase [Hydrogenophilaceae bacterium]|nr:NAD(P)/FAD-dependent oxidoreductase [Hydrogenophilaceae bacterium]